MSHETRLEALRHLLYQRPSPATWSHLCALFHDWPWQEDLEVGLAYAESHLERWPDHLREAPKEWATALVEGYEPPLAWRLVRALVTPSAISNHLKKMMHLPHMAKITQLHIRGVSLSERALRSISQSPHLSAITSLSLQYAAVPTWGALAYLATSPLGRRLERLQLKGQAPNGPLEEDTFALTSFPSLKRLQLNYCHTAAAKLLNRWQHIPAWRALTHLDLANNHLSSVREYEGAYFWQSLTHLNLSHNNLHRGGCNALFEVLQDKPVTSLLLDNAKLRQESFRDLGRYNPPPQLQELSLAHNQLDDNALSALSRLPLLTNIKKLTLTDNPFGERGLSKLIASRHLPTDAKMPYLEAMSNSDLKALVHQRRLKRPKSMSRFKLIDLLLQHAE